METTKNDLPENTKYFFAKLKNYLDTELYYYGSIQRYDYFPEFSDIDVAIFCENEVSTIAKIQYFLNEKKSSFKRFIHRLPNNGKIIYGTKIKYADKYKKFTVEFAIYNKKNKEEVLEEKIKKNNMPFYISYMLYILKFLYYKLQILPFDVFMKLKKICLNYLVEGQDTEYVIL
jgi:hypothetical protein